MSDRSGYAAYQQARIDLGITADKRWRNGTCGHCRAKDGKPCVDRHGRQLRRSPCHQTRAEHIARLGIVTQAEWLEALELS
jgi:hypothetical protein